MIKNNPTEQKELLHLFGFVRGFHRLASRPETADSHQSVSVSFLAAPPAVCPPRRYQGGDLPVGQIPQHSGDGGLQTAAQPGRGPVQVRLRRPLPALFPREHHLPFSGGGE